MTADSLLTLRHALKLYAAHVQLLANTPIHDQSEYFTSEYNRANNLLRQFHSNYTGNAEVQPGSGADGHTPQADKVIGSHNAA